MTPIINFVMRTCLQLRLCPSIVLVLSLLLFAGCRQKDEKADIVVWPALSAFDGLAEKADGLAQVDDLAGLRKLLPKLIKGGSAVVPATIPQNAKKPDGLRHQLADLSDLVAKLSAGNLNDDDLKSYSAALHPLVANLISEAGMPHIHADEGPHGGFFHPVFAADGKQAATLEIKFHNDEGDIEVWLVKGGRDGTPLDLPLASVLKLTFPDMPRTVELRVRDQKTNAGEDGVANIHEGLTNYFIFPGETGADSKWLMSESFAAKAQLLIPGDLTTEVFVLKPHVHHE